MQKLKWLSALSVMALLATTLPITTAAQDRDDDPPGRVARLGYMQGSISFQPAGENEWVEAVPNRPMTTGDKLWSDRDSRAEVQLGSSMINLGANTGFSFLNLDDHTVQMEVTAGAINLRVWNLDRDTTYEIDTPNQAFTVMEPGRYRIETSENGDYSMVTIWRGAGESTGNGQSYTLHAGQRTTFRGTNSLNAEVDQIGEPDDFDRWSDSRYRRWDDSPSARYCSRGVVGFNDLDDHGDWQPSPQYGNVWYPRVDPNWAPYREGHWAWVDPWGWTWVDNEPWGYAPFHYGRWVSVEGRWGWVPGPVEVRPVYAPALVAFVGGVGVGAVAWFPLGPREVYVPSYHVSEAYVNRVNVSNTTVNQTTVTNVYNTTIVNNNTTINNVTYVNRNVRGGVTAVPQQTFASAQPVARAAVQVNERQLASGPVTARAAIPPAPQAVLGPHANTANRVAAPPQAVANRQVTAKTAPPPPPPSFAARQQVLAQHPGVPVARQEMARLAPAPTAAAATRRVVVAPPSKPATPTPAPARAGQPANQPAPAGANQPGARPQPGNQPVPNNRPQPVPPANARPEPNRPEPNQPAPNNRPQPNQPGNRSFEPPAHNDRPPAAQPNRPDAYQPPPNRPQPNQPAPNQPAPNNRPQPNRPDSYQPPPNRPQPNQPAPPNDRPQPERPQANRPAPQNEPAQRPQAAPPNGRQQPAPAHPAPNSQRPEDRKDEKQKPQ